MGIPTWAEKALAGGLVPGRKMRMDCACGTGKTLMVQHGGDVIRAYCFREKESYFHKLELTLQQKLEARRQMERATNEATGRLALPDGLTHPGDWPAAARVWLYDAGFDDDEIRLENIRWNVDMQRVVYPLRMLDGSRAWMARSVDPNVQPKYLFPIGMKRGAGVLQCPRPLEACGTLVVTEDVLSARAVSRAAGGVAGLALLGTSASSAVRLWLAEWAQRGGDVVLWLDGDTYGRLGTSTLLRDLRRLDVEPAVIQTKRDPKLYTQIEIREEISKALQQEDEWNSTK